MRFNLNERSSAGLLLGMLCLVATGCTDIEQENADLFTPQSQGFVWAGSGDPTNFGADFNGCRQFLQPGGSLAGRPFLSPAPTSQPGDAVVRPRDDDSARRAFVSCMAAKGWQAQPRQ